MKHDACRSHALKQGHHGSHDLLTFSRSHDFFSKTIARISLIIRIGEKQNKQFALV